MANKTTTKKAEPKATTAKTTTASKAPAKKQVRSNDSCRDRSKSRKENHCKDYENCR